MVESLWIKGAWVDDLAFGILKDEWEKPAELNPYQVATGKPDYRTVRSEKPSAIEPTQPGV